MRRVNVNEEMGVSTSSKEPKALTKRQFGMFLVGLVLCGVAALVAMGAMGEHHGICPTASQMSRPTNASCYPSYVHQDKTGVLGIPFASPSAP